MKLGPSIRDALAAAGGSLPFRKLHEKVGGADDKLAKACGNLQYNGWITVGKDEDKTITLKSRRGAPQGNSKKPAEKKRMKRARKAARPYKRLADRAARERANGKDGLLLENLIGAGALLRQAIEDFMEDLEGCYGLKHAMANHERAEKLLAAAH